jgi:glutamyl-tRNA synthetase
MTNIDFKLSIIIDNTKIKLASLLSTMSLIVSATSFPYGAAAIALYTGRASLSFDDATAIPHLELEEGSVIAGEDEIINALARAGGISSDSKQVCISHFLCHTSALIMFS